VSDDRRIEELRRRVQKDPASIAFAQLGEELRRAGRFRESVEVCRAGLSGHPGYLSARVTLGRALLDLGDLVAARSELTEVLRVAPENLAAIRGLAEIHRRLGELPEALERYRSAFELARNDPGIEQIVREISKEIDPFGAGVPASRRVAGPRSAGVSGAGAEGAEQAAANPSASAELAIHRLEQWLAAILADRRARLMGAHSL
jgi:tetratricopeptide (TPR) repeat protein